MMAYANTILAPSGPDLQQNTLVCNPSQLQYNLLQHAGIQLPLKASSYAPAEDQPPGRYASGETGRIPVSLTFPNVSTLSSNENGASDSSPSSDTNSEPRNYAPRTSGVPLTSSLGPPLSLRDDNRTSGQHLVLQTPRGTCQITPDSTASPETYSLVRSKNGLMHPFGMDDIRSRRSELLNVITSTSTGVPTLATVMDPSHFPFIENGRQAVAKNHGVVQLRNIPFATKRSEIIAFLGKNSKIFNDSEEPVHIIMERVTSKTMDAYIEFVSLEDAMRAVEKHNVSVNNGHLNRLGDRPIQVELASQASLMRDLFPLANGIIWKGANPELKPFNPDEPWENFKGFISEEEMTMLVKHVEVPHRSPFSRECPQRPYECLISTLKKFPWYMTDCITISQRRAIFVAACELTRLLRRSVIRGDDPVNLTQYLLRRVITAAMGCPGFTPVMKDDVAYLVGMTSAERHEAGQPRFAECWRHLYALCPKPGLPLDVLEWYIAIIREQSQRDMLHLPIDQRNQLQEKSRDTNPYWGFFWAEVNYIMGPEFDTMTLAQAAHAEFCAIERILTRAFPRS